MSNFTEYTILTPALFKQLTTNTVWSSLNSATKTLPLSTLQNMIAEGEKLLNSETAGLFYKQYNPEEITNGTYVWSTTPMLDTVSLVQSTLYRCIVKAVAYKYYQGDIFVNNNISLNGNIQANMNSSTANVDVISLRRDFIADLTALGVYESLANTNPTSQLQAYQALATNGILTTYGSSNSSYFLNLIAQVSNAIMQGNPTWTGVPNFVNSLKINNQPLSTYIAGIANSFWAPATTTIKDLNVIIPNQPNYAIGISAINGGVAGIIGTDRGNPFLAYYENNGLNYIYWNTLSQTSSAFTTLQTQVQTNTTNIATNTAAVNSNSQWLNGGVKWIVSPQEQAIMPYVVNRDGTEAVLTGVDSLYVQLVNGDGFGFGINNGVAELVSRINNVTKAYPFGQGGSETSLWKIDNGIIMPISNTVTDINIDGTNLLSQIGVLENTLNAQASQIDLNTGNISTINTHITSIDSNIKSLEADLTTAETNITTLQNDNNINKTNITTNQTNITMLENDVATIQGDIQTNTTNIATNTTNITNNTNAIQGLQESVATNSNNISTLQSNEFTISAGTNITITQGTGNDKIISAIGGGSGDSLWQITGGNDISPLSSNVSSITVAGINITSALQSNTGNIFALQNTTANNTTEINKNTQAIQNLGNNIPTLIAGTNITIDQSANNYTINATSGGSDILTTNNTFTGMNTFNDNIYFGNSNNTIWGDGAGLTVSSATDAIVQSTGTNAGMVAPNKVVLIQGKNEFGMINSTSGGMELKLQSQNDEYVITWGMNGAGATKSVTLDQIWGVVHSQPQQIWLNTGTSLGAEISVSPGGTLPITNAWFFDPWTGLESTIITINQYNNFELNQVGTYDFYVNFYGDGGATAGIQFNATITGSPTYSAFSNGGIHLSTTYYGSGNGSVDTKASQLLETIIVSSADASNVVNLSIVANSNVALYVQGLKVIFTPRII